MSSLNKARRHFSGKFAQRQGALFQQDIDRLASQRGPGSWYLHGLFLIRTDARARVTKNGAYLVKRNPCDAIVDYVGGFSTSDLRQRALYLEAKTIPVHKADAKNTPFPIGNKSRIPEHQLQWLLDTEFHGALSYFLVRTYSEAGEYRHWLISPMAATAALKDTGKKTSVTFAEIERQNGIVELQTLLQGLPKALLQAVLSEALAKLPRG